VEERASLQPAEPLVATPASPAAIPLGSHTKAKKDRGAAAEILNGFNDEDIQRLLGQIGDKNQLRQLDAGAMRQIPSFAGRVHGPIMAKLGKLPGQVFGKRNFLPGAPENGGGTTPLSE
jgi:hypothetical protein